MIRKLYHALALLALVNLFAMGGLIGFLVATDRLDKERVEQVAKVLRGQWPQERVAASQPIEPPPPPKISREEIEAAQAKRELYRLVDNRHQRESADRLALENSIHLQVLRRLEEIDRKNEEFKKQKQELAQQSQEEGFAQALDMYSNMEPKQAKDLLRLKQKDADVVALLMEMDPNRRKKIVNVCKTPEERIWIGRILNQIQQSSTQPATGVDGPSASPAGG